MEVPMYIGLRLDYRLRLRLWPPVSASRAISAVAELLVLCVKLTRKIET